MFFSCFRFSRNRVVLLFIRQHHFDGCIRFLVRNLNILDHHVIGRCFLHRLRDIPLNDKGQQNARFRIHIAGAIGCHRIGFIHIKRRFLKGLRGHIAGHRLAGSCDEPDLDAGMCFAVNASRCQKRLTACNRENVLILRPFRRTIHLRFTGGCCIRISVRRNHARQISRFFFRLYRFFRLHGFFRRFFGDLDIFDHQLVRRFFFIRQIVFGFLNGHLNLRNIFLRRIIVIRIQLNLNRFGFFRRFFIRDRDFNRRLFFRPAFRRRRNREERKKRQQQNHQR